jgi:lycopene cyclase domain-containing protein
MKSLYLLVDFFTVIVPFMFSFHPKLQFYKTFKSFFLANAIIALVFIAWDVYFTQIGVWGFNLTYLSGIHLFNLPVEEVLFFICIPFSCVFTYNCLNIFYTFKWSAQTEHRVVLFISLTLISVGLWNFQKAYTASTFISLGIVLPTLKYLLKINWLPKLLSIYPVLLFPFFIVNGILTGTGLEQPVVWYDDSENLGIRLLTIPIEDIFYGFELILLNLLLYHKFLHGQFNPTTTKIS